jgi:hypothetical protein
MSVILASDVNGVRMSGIAMIGTSCRAGHFQWVEYKSVDMNAGSYN